jgi:hypothetical protein
MLPRTTDGHAIETSSIGPAPELETCNHNFNIISSSQHLNHSPAAGQIEMTEVKYTRGDMDKAHLECAACVTLHTSVLKQTHMSIQTIQQ